MKTKRAHRHPDDQKLTTKIEVSELIRLAARGQVRPRRTRTAFDPLTLELRPIGEIFTGKTH